MNDGVNGYALSSTKTCHAMGSSPISRTRRRAPRRRTTHTTGGGDRAPQRTGSEGCHTGSCARRARRRTGATAPRCPRPQNAATVCFTGRPVPRLDTPVRNCYDLPVAERARTIPASQSQGKQPCLPPSHDKQAACRYETSASATGATMVAGVRFRVARSRRKRERTRTSCEKQI